jgi:hypothetical protein
MTLLIIFLYSSEQQGLFVGSSNFLSVVPAITLFNQGTTKMTLPSGLGAQMP